MLDHLIEEILHKAHVYREMGSDLIEEYFFLESSLDYITQAAQAILEKNEDPDLEKVILKNLSECIVVKAKKEQYTLVGLTKKALVKLGFPVRKHQEIERAERVLHNLFR